MGSNKLLNKFKRNLDNFHSKKHLLEVKKLELFLQFTSELLDDSLLLFFQDGI